MGVQQSRQMLEAASTGNVQQVSELLKYVSVDSTDDDGWTALHFSSWAGRGPAVKELLNHNANVRARDKRGRMPIHLAALRGQTDVIALLCDHGSPLHDSDADGIAPLHKALGQGHVEAAQHLLAYGADAEQSLPDGTTPLHLAAYSGRAAAVQLLIGTGASVGAQNCDGQTPIFEAAAAGHHEAARVLLQHGANAGHKDKEGFTAADRAPTQLADFLRAPGPELERPTSIGQASSQQPAFTSEGRGLQQGGFMSRLWDGLPSMGPASSGAASVQSPHHRAPKHDLRQRPTVMRPKDSEGVRPRLEPASIQLETLPSAPPLPESHAHALGAASSARSLSQGTEQHSLHPSSHASTHVGPGLEPSRSQSRQGSVRDQQRHHAVCMEEQTLEGSPGSGDRDSGQIGDSAEVSAAVQPAGSLAWAMQAATGASSVAVSALSAWLPWRPDSSMSTRPQQEKPQAALQAQPSSRRYGLNPGGSEEDEGDQSAVEHLASTLQGMQVSGCEAPSFRVFRQTELSEATNGFSEAANRLDMAGSPNSAFLGGLPTASLDMPQHIGGMQVVVKGYRDMQHGRSRLDDSAAAAMAEVKHPNLLPLIGVCTESSSAVYDFMENGSLDDALHGRRPKLAAVPVRLDWVSRTRVAAETASALMHLHSLQPSGFAHGGLRPSCILLDRECSARIEDAAIHAIFRQPQVCDQAADVFALGVIMLQLLTGSEAHGLAQHAAEVLRHAEGVARLVDPCAGDWPIQAASEFCSLAVRCTAWQASERPSLGSEVLPALSRLVGRAEGAVAGYSKAHDADPPAFLLCPITQELFEDPVVCADGYTYSRAAIAQWLQSGHGTSPITNLPLSSRELRPNYTLRSAAMEWQEARQAQQR